MEVHISSIEPDVIAWRRDIHQFPELGNRETRTAAKIAEHLTALGIDVQTGVAHTGVVGILRGNGPGPVVALRADMDALPITEAVDLPFASTQRTIYNGEEVGVMHACGHDTHVAILMGVADVLARSRDSWPGTVKFIFQPAEEGAPSGENGGAKMMVEEGVLTNPDVDAAFALHIDALMDAGSVAYYVGGAFASSDNYRIVVRGKGAHGARPWMSVDPIVAAAHIVTGLQTIVSRNADLLTSAAVVTVGTIHGGVRRNIIPDEVEMTGTIRALDPEVRELLLRRVPEVATGIAESLGATAEVELPMSTPYPVTFNDGELTTRMIPVLTAVAGEDNTVHRPAKTAAEDFSYISREVPGFYFGLGGKPVGQSLDETAGHHTPEFRIDEGALVLGVRAMTALAVAFLSGDE